MECQVCLVRLKGVIGLRRHMHSGPHRKKMKEFFPQDNVTDSGPMPYIIFMDSQKRHCFSGGITRLSLLTMCFGLKPRTAFYLCHVCEEKISLDKILNHFRPWSHHNNYFNYTDPNVLNLSWIPNKEARAVQLEKFTEEMNTIWAGRLQMLHLPETLLGNLKSKTYSEVMESLNENNKLLELFQVGQPKRMMIEMYQTDSNREHPLLGMQHIVECICSGPPEKRHYLCMLCSLTVSTNMIIRHILSFDHLFCYFKAFHPSTLKSKECYSRCTDTDLFNMMLDFSKQSESIHTTENTAIKQVSLEPAEFKSVKSKGYAEALKELESITKSHLTPSITPQKKLEASYGLHCQNCSNTFQSSTHYVHHLQTLHHHKVPMLKKHFVHQDLNSSSVSLHLGFNSFFIETLKSNQPPIGTALVVACVTSERDDYEPIYVCFACRDCFFTSSLVKHFDSQKHHIQTLLYLNPWRLPFAWQNHLKDTDLRSMAWEEEKERGTKKIILKVLDIPAGIFFTLNPWSYTAVMENLALYHILLKHEVPKCETYSKLQENERFPQLGKQFLVRYIVGREHNTEVRFLCLLCERKLSNDESDVHVFSWEHVATFLTRFHPDSLNASIDSAQALLDLAKLAGRIHRIAYVQVIDTIVREPCSYSKTLSILESAKRRDGKGRLTPDIKLGAKLVLRIVKQVEKDHVRDDNQSSSSSNNNELCDKGGEKETPTPSENRSEMRREEKKTAGETCQEIKEKPEEPTTRKPNEALPETCTNTDKDDGAETGSERSTDSEVVPMEVMNSIDNKRKRLNSRSEKSKEDRCPDEDGGREMSHKRQRFICEEETSCEEPTKISRSGQDENATDVEQSNKAATDKAMQSEQYSRRELLLTSTPSCVKLKDTSVTIHDISSTTGNFQVSEVGVGWFQKIKKISSSSICHKECEIACRATDTAESEINAAPMAWG
ncbi:uncharacterized protein [Brachyistius frenatus]|uniref:uncharacterized protein n=1 Tax=Brachyistius frenatus TaxID=100188 RepID=UPI0037E770A3